MSKTIAIPAHEFGQVRVFSLSMSDAEARALKANQSEGGSPPPLELALGSEALNDGHVEVFAVADLGDMGLAGFLVEGAGIPRADVEADRLRLAALDGWVMIVYSSAFQGIEQVLNPSAQLTLVASYRQEEMDWTAPVNLSTPSALPQYEDTPEPAPRKRPSDAAMSGRIAMLALIVAFLVVGLMIWIGG